MKNLIYICVLCSIISCTATRITPSYEMKLGSVEKPKDVNNRFSNPKIVFLGGDSSKYNFQDSIISIDWWIHPSKSEFRFTINNKTSHSLKIIWDDAAFVNSTGGSERVFHSGIKYNDREKSMPPSIIVRNGNFTDLVVPSEKVTWETKRIGDHDYSSWNQAALFPNSYSSLEEAKKETEPNRDKTLQILLPIQIENTINEYIFIFEVQKIIYDTKTVVDSKKTNKTTNLVLLGCGGCGALGLLGVIILGLTSPLRRSSYSCALSLRICNPRFIAH